MSDDPTWSEVYSMLMQLHVAWPKLNVIHAIAAATDRGVQEDVIEDRIRTAEPDSKHLLLSR